MDAETRIALLRLGLGQIPVSGLERLAKRLKAGKPVLLNGAVYDKEAGYG